MRDLLDILPPDWKPQKDGFAISPEGHCVIQNGPGYSAQWRHPLHGAYEIVAQDVTAREALDAIAGCRPRFEAGMRERRDWEANFPHLCYDRPAS